MSITITIIVIHLLLLQKLVIAFNVHVTLRASWPEISNSSLALEFLRQIDATEAATALLSGKVDPEHVQARLQAVPQSAFNFFQEIRLLAPVVEAARAHCRHDRMQSLPNCSGPFLLRRRRDGSVMATCLRDGSSKPAQSMVIHASDFVVRKPLGSSQTEVVVCATVDEAFRWLPISSTTEQVVFRHDDHNHAGNAPDYIVGHSVELRIKKTEYSVVVEETVEEDEGETVLAGDSAAEDLKKSAASVELSTTQLGNLPLQVSRLLLRSRAPLVKWRELTENFPALMQSLVKTKRPSKKIVAQLWGDAASLRRATSGHHLALNGRDLDAGFGEAPHFYFAERALEEAVALERQARGAAAAGAADSVQRLNWRGSKLTWHYDVRRDEEAEEWPSRVTALAAATREDADALLWAGLGSKSPHSQAGLKVRMPLVSIVVAFHPEDQLMLDVIKRLLVAPLAGKVSILPFDGDLPTPKWNSDQLGEMPLDNVTAIPPTVASSSLLAGALWHAASRGKAAEFASWLLKFTVTPASPEELKKGFLKFGDTSEKKAKAAWGKLNGAKARSDVLGLGLPVPSILVNGRILLPTSEGGANVTSEQLQKMIRSEQERFSTAAKAGSLKKVADQQLEEFALGPTSKFTNPPYAVLPSRPCPSLQPDVVAQLPTLQGRTGGTDRSAVLFLLSTQDLAWLYPVVLWLRGADPPSSVAFAMTVELPWRECISSLVQNGHVVALAQLGFEVLQGRLDKFVACEAAGPGHGEVPKDVKTLEAESILALSLPPAQGGAAMYCNGQIFDLRHGVTLHATKALERQACSSQAEVQLRKEYTWDRALANLSQVTTIDIGAKEDAWIQVRGIVDPLAEDAPRIAAALEALSTRLQASVMLQLQPASLQKEPMRKFTRTALPLASAFDDVAGLARFDELVSDDILTLEVTTPSCWSVTARKSNVDLDNLRRVDVLKHGGHIDVEYELQSVYVEGSAMSGKEAASGLQLELLEGATVLGETIVMQNLGYFALEGRFGGVLLRTKPGTSNETFALVKSGSNFNGFDHSFGGDGAMIRLDKWLLPNFQLGYQLRPGQKASNLFDNAKGRPKSLKRKASRARGNFNASLEGSCPTIHVFSVASGHLYEKLLRVMMISARKNTKCPLRFWFFDGFMSPDFKASMVQFATALDVSFEFIAFKWPSWLRDSHGAHFGIRGDKQRLIWAHKILFLDVIFPLDLQRIIFLDADLTIRGDLLELYTMDLHGAPYAFTPFCSGQRVNTETTGYRFWDSGFWKDHLQEQPYHISALFVVDLAAFRRQSVGDTLRGIYHSMAGDPNSLSNLDQDLPNYAQSRVRIRALPPDWLWCESWCSDESKAAAKAIDLCQNPKTKENKVLMAKRLISEWSALDQEASDIITSSAKLGHHEL